MTDQAHFKTKVVNKHHADHRGPDDVYIGRPSRWGNPFSHLPGKGDVQVASRDEAVERYRVHLWSQIKSGDVSIADLADLSGKTLVCWCRPAACHGDVLASAADWAKRNLDAMNGGLS